MGLARTFHRGLRGGAGESGSERGGGPGLWEVVRRGRRFRNKRRRHRSRSRKPRRDGCRRTLTGCGVHLRSRSMGTGATLLVRGRMTRGGAPSMGGFLFRYVSLAALGYASSSRDMVGFAKGMGRFISGCPSLSGMTTVYMCPGVTRMIGSALRTSRMGVTYMSNNFPSSRAFARMGMTRATVTLRAKTSRVSVIVPMNGFLDKSCRKVYSRVRRLGTMYNRRRLGIVLRAKTLKDTSGVGGTSVLSVCSKTSFVGASAKGRGPTTAPRTTLIVYRTVGRCCVAANHGMKFGPTKKVGAMRSTLICCAVMGRILKRR